MKSRVIKQNVNRKVLPCLLVKMFCKFPATSCSDSISICDKDKNNYSRLIFYYHSQKKADSHYSSNADLGSIHTHVCMDVTFIEMSTH